MHYRAVFTSGQKTRSAAETPSAPLCSSEIAGANSLVTNRHIWHFSLARFFDRRSEHSPLSNTTKSGNLLHSSIDGVPLSDMDISRYKILKLEMNNLMLRATLHLQQGQLRDKPQMRLLLQLCASATQSS